MVTRGDEGAGRAARIVAGLAGGARMRAGWEIRTARPASALGQLP